MEEEAYASIAGPSSGGEHEVKGGSVELGAAQMIQASARRATDESLTTSFALRTRLFG